MLGESTPDRLFRGGKALLGNHVRNKGDPIGIEVELVDAMPTRSILWYGMRMDLSCTVSTGDLAPHLTDADTESSNDPDQGQKTPRLRMVALQMFVMTREIMNLPTP